MAGVIDTCVLTYAVNTDADEHKAARAFLQEVGRSADRWYLTEGILYEFLRVVTHPKVFDRPLTWQQALSFLSPFTDRDRFSILSATEHHWSALAEILAQLHRPGGNLFFDVRTAVLMREHGVRAIYTADTDFLQFEDLDVINPMRR